MRTRSRVGFASLVLLSLLLAVGPAGAGNWVIDSPLDSSCIDQADQPNVYLRNPCLGDNGQHTYHFEPGFGPLMTTAVNWTNDGSYDTTDLDTLFENVAHNGSTDVYHENNDNLANGVNAIYFCVTDAAGYRCNHAHVQYHGDYNTTAAGGAIQNSVSRRYALACHETGHSVGLLHTSEDSNPNTQNEDKGCMYNNPVFGDANGVDALVRGHNVGHINNFYP